MISDVTEKPLASWRGKERYDTELLDCLTVIFKSGGCSWSKCRMCSYRHERYGKQSCDELLAHLRAQLAMVLRENPVDGYRMVKIFTSGSFFDPAEVPPAFLQDVASAFRGKLLIAETRPEFVQEAVFRNFIDAIDDGSWKTPLYCAIGLETSSDAIREKCINKGFSFADFRCAADTAHAIGAGVKAYLLFKPLFLTEQEALKDMETTIADIQPFADMISMNPCTVQRNTELEYYWKRGAYRPPYLWSVLSILKNAPGHITCDPLGGGQKRGPHNCGKCDYEIVKGIRDYSLNADKDLIGALFDTVCACKQEWEFILAEEKPWCMPLTR
ncbi:archaeosine biosynthesis radical SAM protein RaSEA [Methanoregula sp.]|uniref:archaeosine biosynthesis radical SAM protein RaSEA n=1 Tax=Methanoregula sp. TaxID=2052170 RepID=UPI002372F31A|nr:archaeosine biosynthesis radical SAM protein RaSEA [Methanoregula sp.]MDD1685982.1 archaeosine biosynthesis radical SAM protein RaSEA [Methanoregula sp.]